MFYFVISKYLYQSCMRTYVCVLGLEKKRSKNKKQKKKEKEKARMTLLISKLTKVAKGEQVLVLTFVAKRLIREVSVFLSMALACGQTSFM